MNTTVKWSVLVGIILAIVFAIAAFFVFPALNGPDNELSLLTPATALAWFGDGDVPACCDEPEDDGWFGDGDAPSCCESEPEPQPEPPTYNPPPYNPPPQHHPKPYCTINDNPPFVDYGGSVTLTWSSNNATSASLTHAGSVPVNGSYTFHNLTQNTTYTLTVYGPGGTATCNETVKVKQQPQAPHCTLDISPNQVNHGGNATITWNSDNATSASLTDFGSVNVDGSRSLSNITSTKTYTLTVTGPGGTATCQTTVTVEQPLSPWCAIWASPQSIQQGGTSKLEWTSGYANSASINQGIGSVSLQGSRNVSPSSTKTYTMTVTGDGGTATCQTTVTVEQAASPWCSLWASPSTIQQGNSSQLQWNSGNASSATLTDHGSVPVNGSRSVSPNNTKTYTLTVQSNSGQTATCEATVHVQQQSAPSCSIWANPTNVSYGGSTTVTWDSTNATSASLTDAGSVNVDGSRSFSNITGTRTFTLTVWNNQGQTNTCQTTVYTNQQQNLSCNLYIYPSSIQRGNTATMQWSSNNATHASIDSLGSVGTQGSTTISPTYSKTYTMTVWNNQGQTNTCTAHINVTEQPAGNLWCTITANPSHIGKSGSATLSWQMSSTATSAQLSDGIGYVSIGSGSLTVRPESNRTYVLTIRDQYGNQQTCSTTVRVDGSPYISLTAVPYTGFGDGIGGILGMVGALAVAVSAGFLLTSYRRELFDTIDGLVSRRA